MGKRAVANQRSLVEEGRWQHGRSVTGNCGFADSAYDVRINPRHRAYATSLLVVESWGLRSGRRGLRQSFLPELHCGNSLVHAEAASPAAPGGGKGVLKLYHREAPFAPAEDPRDRGAGARLGVSHRASRAPTVAEGWGLHARDIALVREATQSLNGELLGNLRDPH